MKAKGKEKRPAKTERKKARLLIRAQKLRTQAEKMLSEARKAELQHQQWVREQVWNEHDLILRTWS